MQKTISPVLWTIVGIVLASIFWLTLGDKVEQKFNSLRNKTPEVQPLSPNQKVQKCAEGDSACQEKNEQIMINNLEGTAIEFAKHQCDGPRSCPTPIPEVNTEAQEAIRSFVKEDTLFLLRITGINPAGTIYYCTKDNRCWSYDTKEKNVKLLEPTFPQTEKETGVQEAI